MTFWNDLKERYQKLIEEYGSAAIATYLFLYFGTWFGFWVAITQGLDVGSGSAHAGTIGGAWVANKMAQPVRILATLAITPVAVRLWRKIRPRPLPEAGPPST